MSVKKATEADKMSIELFSSNLFLGKLINFLAPQHNSFRSDIAKLHKRLDELENKLEE